MTDLHNALRAEIVNTKSTQSVEMVLARLQHGKDQFRTTLHARPHGYTTAGWQTTDVLSRMGFRHSRCSFVVGGQCFAREVERDFDLDAFVSAFDITYRLMQEGVDHLGSCGFLIQQPAGWEFFTGRRHDSDRALRFVARGDGHNAPKHERMKTAEDEALLYAFSWIEGSSDKGWTTHYRPKHPPLSAELASLFEFLGLRRFDTCPEFEFEPCWWRFTPFDELAARDRFMPANTAHGWFDAHSTHFSSGIKALLNAEATVQPFGISVLPVKSNVPPTVMQPAKRSATVKATPRPGAAPTAGQFDYDVAVSFAGSERQVAETIANRVRDAGFNVFYDGFYPEQLWGKDLSVFFDEVFRKRSRYCLILSSKAYGERAWTNHERRSAVTRMIEERGGEYILPVKVDASELPGVPGVIGYLELDEHGANGIADVLIHKLRRAVQ